jgi:PAS domain S-box-containing protein
MAWQFTVYTVPLLFSGALAAVVASLIWRDRQKSGATAVALETFVIAIWGVSQAVLVSAVNRDLALVGHTVTMINLAVVPPLWAVFAMQYTGRGHLVARGTVAALAVEPLVFAALVVTNGSHGLVYTDPVMVTTGGRRLLTYDLGVALVAHLAYESVVLLWANWLLFKKFLASRNVYRKRTFFLMLSSVLLSALHLLGRSGLTPLPDSTLGPLVFLAIGVLALLFTLSNRFVAMIPIDRFLAYFSRHSESLAPAARDTAIEELSSGFLVTDHKNRVVDVNPVGRLMLGQEGERIVGKQLQNVLPTEVFLVDDTDFLEPDATGTYQGLWVETPAGENRCFDVTINPLGTDDEGRLTGRVALIHDVTEREKRKQKLERRTEELKRQNDQLDSFASIVSHDLRNPINVASGRLEIIETKTDGAEESIAETEAALERMEDIINDVLTLARLGQTLDETEPVALRQVAQEAWDHVDTKDATFQNDLDLTVEGSESRLLQAFENLFRNAIEHGRDDVTITAGECDGAFFVEDDGPGIPAEHRDEVLREGFTTNEDGTGFGLSIVTTIVDAHGWGVTVTESNEGGARFEMTGVIQPQEQVLRSPS